MAVVEVVCKNLKKNPHCPHGPTLKFVRVQDGHRQKFFACSAYRDRKDCAFYLTADSGQEQTQRMQQHWAQERLRMLPPVDHQAMEARLVEVRQAVPKDRLYCHTCCQLDIVLQADNHRTHRVTTGVSDHMLSHPSQIFMPKESSKKEAQYLFANSTTQVIVSNLSRAGVSLVLCLGTPRVHEHIQAMAESGLQSILLDIDHRHHSFWPVDKFVWFNMFNRHFLSTEPEPSRMLLHNLLASSCRVALVMDPPFGGHVQPLAATVKHFSKLVTKTTGHKLMVIWIFPYFRERHIIEECPTLAMMDYKVQYNNHKHFNNGAKGRKLGSPVRLFTNMDPSQFELPGSEDYRLCLLCRRWVATENRHCAKCNACTSKDGRTYVHCDRCGVCVKPQWKHCDTCLRCLPSPHICNTRPEKVLSNEDVKLRHKQLKTQQQVSISKTSKSRKKRKKQLL